MFQCLGLGTVEDGGCGEDWWHPECLMGLPRAQPSVTAAEEEKKEPQVSEGQDETDEAPLPAGFPAEDDFDHLICYKCVDSFPWIKRYAGYEGFLGPVFHKATAVNKKKESAVEAAQPTSIVSKKRSAEDEPEEAASKKTKVESEEGPTETTATHDPSSGSSPEKVPIHAALPPAPSGSFSLFLKEDFRSHFCRCPQCFPHLKPHPQLTDEEEAYEPPVSESDAEDQNGRASVGSGSTYERGEALLSNMDRVKAIGKFPLIELVNYH